MIIYRFWPHGSKNLENIIFDHNDFDEHQPIPGTDVMSHLKLATMPLMIAHDQEPLNYSLYSKNVLSQFAVSRINKPVDLFSHPEFDNLTKFTVGAKLVSMHLRSAVDIPVNIYDQILLCHSEKNSLELAKYELNGFVGVYWWSHAAIARDWYRYAFLDKKLQFTADEVLYDFLIYNRAWTGSREYRVKFTELIVKNSLQNQCLMKFNPTDGAHHYKTYDFANKSFSTNIDLEKYFEQSVVSSSCSGDYDVNDYKTCGIEVVLETLFDDCRVHLTEKILRPIACGKPFLLVSTPGALSYLKHYGFKTFDPILDESYDSIIDPVQRLCKIIDVMKQISSMSIDAKKQLWAQLQDIADYNQQKFFSSDFLKQVTQEFVENLQIGLDSLESNKKGSYYNWYKPINIRYGHRFFKPNDMEYIESKLKRD